MFPRSALIFTALILLFALSAPAQSNLETWYSHKLQQDRDAMFTLLSWGTTSTLTGGLMLITGREHFGLMTASWGVINLGIAGYGLLTAPSPGADITFSKALRNEKRLRNFLIINSALNVGYVAAGAALWRHSDSRRIKEYGAAIVGQGVFLMIFDAAYLVITNRRLEKLQILPSEAGIGASLRVTF